MDETFNLHEIIGSPWELRLEHAYLRVRDELLADRKGESHWTGTLSSSALSTATAVSALSASRTRPDLIADGVNYLRRHQNVDGGFGDTDRSHSNVATSYLVLSASELAKQFLGEDAGLSITATERLRYRLHSFGELDGLRRRYGKDKTFVVPIMTNMAIAGILSWESIPALPFEAAAFPQSWYRFLRMPVVSYAIPALVAMGQARHLLGSAARFPLRQLRDRCIEPTMRVLQAMQPASGGYLEATPLTAFVVMSLAATQRQNTPVGREGLRFLTESMREDGGWPIDTDLATWVTSLSIRALTLDVWNLDSSTAAFQPTSRIRETIDWLLACQHLEPHPYTGANPGGWGWTGLSGAVPDGDDTPAAILALLELRKRASDSQKEKIDHAIKQGIHWLLGLQNRDGGMPTFCRGWGKLPFDRSSTDLTAHAIRAWRGYLKSHLELRGRSAREKDIHRAIERARKFLRRSQQSDGSFLPLWFGNQDREQEDNPVYGTSRVLLAIAGDATMASQADRAVQFLLTEQNEDGGWGGGTSVNDNQGYPSPRSTIEESALALEALAAASATRQGGETERHSAIVMPSIIRAVDFLVEQIEQDGHRQPWPIGFYFAKLWYYERLYPLLFATAALGSVRQLVRPTTV